MGAIKIIQRPVHWTDEVSFCSSNQVSMEVVTKMLGYSSVNMTRKYARVVDDLIKKDMQKIAGKYDKVMAN